MKKAYQKPNLEVIAFESEDIITTSGVDSGVTVDPSPDVPDTGVEFPEWE